MNSNTASTATSLTLLLYAGNPGTGKTTVAKLYGKMLQQFGFLSDGDFVMVTPSDLKGSHPGEAAANTKVSDWVTGWVTE